MRRQTMALWAVLAAGCTKQAAAECPHRSFYLIDRQQCVNHCIPGTSYHAAMQMCVTDWNPELNCSSELHWNGWRCEPYGVPTED